MGPHPRALALGELAKRMSPGTRQCHCQEGGQRDRDYGGMN